MTWKTDSSSHPEASLFDDLFSLFYGYGLDFGTYRSMMACKSTEEPFPLAAPYETPSTRSGVPSLFWYSARSNREYLCEEVADYNGLSDDPAGICSSIKMKLDEPFCHSTWKAVFYRRYRRKRNPPDFVCQPSGTGKIPVLQTCLSQTGSRCPGPLRCCQTSDTPADSGTRLRRQRNCSSSGTDRSRPYLFSLCTKDFGKSALFLILAPERLIPFFLFLICTGQINILTNIRLSAGRPYPCR